MANFLYVKCNMFLTLQRIPEAENNYFIAFLQSEFKDAYRLYRDICSCLNNFTYLKHRNCLKSIANEW